MTDERCIADNDLDANVDAFGAEIVANSWGTNRIDKALLRAHGDMTRSDARRHERSLPFGTPDDTSEGMARSKK